MKKMKDIPKKFHNMVQPKSDAKPDESDFKFIIPSGQFWNDLTPKERDELRQIIFEEGQNLDDYLYQMRKMLPYTPRGK